MKQHIDSITTEIGHQAIVQASSLCNSEQICAALNLIPEQDITFRANEMVLTKWEEEPEFANIELVVIKDVAVKLIVKHWFTLYFNQHYSAYAVKESNHHIQVKAPEDLDHKPLHVVKCYDPNNSVWFVITRFKLA